MLSWYLCYRDNPESMCRTISRQTCYVCRADLNRVAIGKTVFPRCAACMGQKRLSFAYGLLAMVEQHCTDQMNAIALETALGTGVTSGKNHCPSLLWVWIHHMRTHERCSRSYSMFKAFSQAAVAEHCAQSFSCFCSPVLHCTRKNADISQPS